MIQFLNKGSGGPLTQAEYDTCLELSKEILNVPELIDMEFLSLTTEKTLALGININYGYKYVMKFKDNTEQLYEAYVGCKTITGIFFCRVTDNKISYSGTSGNLQQIPTDSPGDITFKFSKGENAEIILGTVHRSDAPNAAYDLYYLKVYDENNNNQLIHDFVPKMYSTGRKGLYDNVTKRFIEY